MTQSPPPQPVIDYATPGARRPRSFSWILKAVLFFGLVITLFIVLQNKNGSLLPVSLSQFTVQLQSGNVRTIRVEKDSLSGQFVAPVLVNTTAGTAVSVSNFDVRIPAGSGDNWAFMEWLLGNAKASGSTVPPDIQVGSPNNLIDIFVPLIPWLIIVAVIYFLIVRQLRRQPAGLKLEPLRVFVVNQEVR